MEALMEGCVERCPGCAHRYMTREESLTQKEGWIRKQLAAWNGVVETIRSVDDNGRWGYRRKVLLTARFTDNRWDFGMIRRDEFIAIPGCPVHALVTRQVIRLLASVLPPFGFFPLAYLFQSDALVTLVVKSKQQPTAGWLTDEVIHELAVAGIQGLSVHCNPSAGRRMFARGGWHLLWGTDHAYNPSGLVYGRTSFSQLIHRLHSASLDEAEAFLDPGPVDCVVDLYCGIGSSLVRWVKKGAHTAGVESGGEAVECAARNVPEAMVLRGACRHRIPQLKLWLQEKNVTGGRRLLYANPPRTGIEHEVLEWITGSLLPEKIAYLSCSAGTLKRDLEVLAASGYQVCRIIPYDFFPQTHHVECLVLAGRI